MLSLIFKNHMPCYSALWAGCGWKCFAWIIFHRDAESISHRPLRTITGWSLAGYLFLLRAIKISWTASRGFFASHVRTNMKRGKSVPGSQPWAGCRNMGTHFTNNEANTAALMMGSYLLQCPRTKIPGACMACFGFALLFRDGKTPRFHLIGRAGVPPAGEQTSRSTRGLAYYTSDIHLLFGTTSHPGMAGILLL